MEIRPRFFVLNRFRVASLEKDAKWSEERTAAKPLKPYRDLTRSLDELRIAWGKIIAPPWTQTEIDVVLQDMLPIPPYQYSHHLIYCPSFLIHALSCLNVI